MRKTCRICGLDYSGLLCRGTDYCNLRAALRRERAAGEESCRAKHDPPRSFTRWDRDYPEGTH